MVKAKLLALFSVSTLMALVASLFVAVPATASPYRPTAAEFDPGNLISDAAFFDRNAMTEEQIQRFLDIKIGTCNNANCLNVLKMDTPDKPVLRTDVTTGRLLCSAYTGGPQESAARIIYKFQQACGISAKVILVTLQKEQGLLNNRAPSLEKLARAMGAGCPDGVGGRCDANNANFFKQIRYGTSQLKRYTTSDSMHYRATPVTLNIRYDVEESCGTKRVTIANQATSALYRYTPYTPNDAALGNLWGTGNSCSAYGNRNFWRDYNTWFNFKKTIYSRVAALPEATRAALGQVVSEANCPETTNNCIINYQMGVVSFALMGTLQVSFGPIGIAYRNSGGPAGPLGAMVGSQVAIVAGGTGYRQRFTNGYIYQAPNGSTFTLTNAMHDFYAAQGGPAGALGWPASAARTSTTRTDQLFDNGLIITNSAGQLSVLLGSIGEVAHSVGGINAPWGLPTAARQTVSTTSFGNGARQSFQNGVAFEKTGSTAVFVANALIPAVTAVGQNIAGWPTGATQSSGVNRFQTFTAGTLFGSTAHSNGILVPTPLAAVWTSTGGATSFLGFPTAAAQAVTDAQNVAGSFVTFTGGAIISSPAGVFAQPAGIRTKYLAAGGPSGVHGFPIAAPTLSAGVWTQRYTNGTITTAVPVTRPTIQLGSRGTHVRYLQSKLNLRVDGIFGTRTRAAVIAFQKSKGLTADGIVGPRTWAALG